MIVRAIVLQVPPTLPYASLSDFKSIKYFSITYYIFIITYILVMVFDFMEGVSFKTSILYCFDFLIAKAA